MKTDLRIIAHGLDGSDGLREEVIYNWVVWQFLWYLLFFFFSANHS